MLIGACIPTAIFLSDTLAESGTRAMGSACPLTIGLRHSRRVFVERQGDLPD
jgi:hypothetical protein